MTPDTSKACIYDIVLSGVTEPTNGNYEPISLKNGTLTITARPSSGGSSGSHSRPSTPTYSVSGTAVKNGSMTLSTRSASKGSTVMITVKPEEGYQLASLTVRDGNGNSVTITQKTSDTYTFVMPAGKVSVEPVFERIKAEQIGFADVKSSDYFHDAVQWAVAQGITEGTSSNTFSPNASCTRAQMVTFLWRAAGSPEPKRSVDSFSDLDPSAYYYKAVLWAIENGITNGTSTDTFSPHMTVTRGQTVTFLYRAAGAPSHDGDSAFHDVNSSDYYFDSVAWAAKNSITGGTGDGKFSPSADCTRAQIVTMLYRANT